MASLIAHDIDDSIVQALQERARCHGVSVEVEHRKILEQVLLQPVKKTFTEVLGQIPNVGKDADFERV